MIVSTQIVGMDRLAKTLLALPGRLRRQALRPAVSAGARVVAKAIRARAPKGESGTIRRAVFQAAAKELTSNVQVGYVAGVRRGKKYAKGATRVFKGHVRTNKVSRDAYYWPWVEFGHKIVPRRGKNGAGIASRRRAVAHLQASGQGRTVPAHPFLRPAFNAAQSAAREAMIAVFRAEISGLKA